MKSSSSSVKATAVPASDRLQEFVAPFNLADARGRIAEFGQKYPKLNEEIENLKQEILRSEQVAKYANKEDVADFCISEILHLSKENILSNGSKFFSKSEAKSDLPRSFKEVTKTLVEKMAEEVQSNQDPVLINSLAGKYLTGFGVEKDEAEAARLCRLAADQGYTPAQFNLGALYHIGIGVEKDVVEAARLYRLAADQGYAQAQCTLGTLYYKGTGVKINVAEAARLYRSAAEQGHAEAQYCLGALYYNGTGVEKDVAEAVRFCRLAADQGHAQAQFNLGNSYFKGTGVEKDVAEAARLYRSAADQGYAPAQNTLGNFYSNGTGVEKNEAEAARLYRLAADQGYAQAQCNLGNFYFNGTGVKKNEAQAARLYRSAAEQGHAVAQCNLGILYLRGSGVEENSTQAILWYVRASASFKLAEDTLNQKMFASSSHVVSVKRDQNNSALSASEIIEVISANKLQARVTNSRSNLIGDLVEVSESRLSAEELLKIYSTLAKTGGVDVAQSKSCATIADSWAKKLGQEIGLEGKELEKIKVLSRDADRVSCQLPSGIGAKSASVSSLGGGGEELLKERKGQLRSKAGITECRQDPKTGNLIVTADATELSAILPSATLAAIYSPPQESVSNPMPREALAGGSESSPPQFVSNPMLGKALAGVSKKGAGTGLST